MDTVNPFKNKVFSVTEISRIIKDLIETALPSVQVQGEISNLKQAKSGHIYFDLKDENALIPAVLFKGYSKFLSAELEDGLLVTAKAQTSCYIRQGRYQLIVTSVKVEKQGNLYLKFEKLKQKLKEKGYFDEERKKPIPAYPKRIAIVTSATGAALRDILSILKERHPNLEVVIAHSAVQGADAKRELAEALKNINKLKPAPEVILLGRGGGSMEDLWPFNEEIVAKAVYNSKIPIISCVGHETDFTITDFTADLRVPTPSAAAQTIVKNQKEVFESLRVAEKRLIKALTAFYERRFFTFKQCVNSAVFKNPNLIWQNKIQTFDRVSENFHNTFNENFRKTQEKLKFLNAKLNTLNPKAVLKRGYSVLRHKGKILKASNLVKQGDEIKAELFKGNLTCKVTDK